MRPADGSSELEQLLGEQISYYRALAAEYEDHALPFAGGNELSQALDAFRPTGSVLELACGTGAWTGQLLHHATEVTAVDASPEMLAITSARTNSEQVRFVQADLFSWEPDRRYDVVFFRLLALARTAGAVRVLLVARGGLPETGWPCVLRRRRVPHLRRAG